MSEEFSGQHVLVVDDEPLIAMDVAITIEDHGGAVVGPASSVASALSMLRNGDKTPLIDVAVLDINLAGENCRDVGLRLRELDIPFVLHTGNWSGMDDLIAELDAPVVRKPAQSGELATAVAGVLFRLPAQ